MNTVLKSLLAGILALVLLAMLVCAVCLLKGGCIQAQQERAAAEYERQLTREMTRNVTPEHEATIMKLAESLK